MIPSQQKLRPKSLLFGTEISLKNHALVHYLAPAIGSFLLYVLILASDISVIFRHYKDDNPIWGSLTLFFMYIPALGSFIVTVCSPELWPQPEVYCNGENAIWFIEKTILHFLFPLWSIWRYAERIFWSIEAIRNDDDEERIECIRKSSGPRNNELYVFLQAFTHSLPQVLFQFFLLMRHKATANKQTSDAEAMCFIVNLAKVAITTTYYQRFKSQKLAGVQYPWFKSYKYPFHQPLNPNNLIDVHEDEQRINGIQSVDDKDNKMKKTIQNTQSTSKTELKSNQNETNSKATGNIDDKSEQDNDQALRTVTNQSNQDKATRPNTKHKGAANILGPSGITTTKENTLIGAMKEEGIDSAEEDRIDSAEEDRIDSTEENRFDSAEEDTLDAAQENTIDATKKDPIDATKEDIIDAAREDTIDAAKKDKIDAEKKVTIDATKEDTRADATDDEITLRHPDRENFQDLPEDDRQESLRRRSSDYYMKPIVPHDDGYGSYRESNSSNRPAVSSTTSRDGYRSYHKSDSGNRQIVLGTTLRDGYGSYRESDSSYRPAVSSTTSRDGYRSYPKSYFGNRQIVSSTTSYDGCGSESDSSSRPRTVNRRLTTITEKSEPKFDIFRKKPVKALGEDDAAGRLVAFCWWYAFILSRILTISVFFYFYDKPTIYLLAIQCVFTVAFLIYDVRTDEVQRAKFLFFIFLSVIYIFCIIEFKIKFKKSKFIYFAYFTVIYSENFVMCLIWWFTELDSIENDFWFRYVFYIIIVCSILSVGAKLFYFKVNKPSKSIVGYVEVKSSF